MAIFGPQTLTAVLSTATQVYTPTSGGVQQNPTVMNVGANNVFIGSSSVTASTGLKLVPGGQLTLDATEEAIYAIAADSSHLSTCLSGLSTLVAVA